MPIYVKILNNFNMYFYKCTFFVWVTGDMSDVWLLEFTVDEYHELYNWIIIYLYINLFLRTFSSNIFTSCFSSKSVKQNHSACLSSVNTISCVFFFYRCGLNIERLANYLESLTEFSAFLSAS